MLALVLTVCLLSVLASAAAFTGVDGWFLNEVTRADEKWGVIPEDFRNLDFKGNITRLEFCQMALLAYQSMHGQVENTISRSHFSDTQNLEPSLAHNLRLVSGYPDGTFRPDSPITRQEMFVMIYNLMTADNAFFGKFN